MDSIQNKILLTLSFILLVGFACDKKNTIKTEGDTQSPTVSITAPMAGSTVSGDASVTVSASDNVGVTKVEVYIDNALSITDEEEPWEYVWDTSLYSDGSHTLLAKAYDAQSNEGTSDAVTVTVSNTLDLTFNNNVFTDVELTVSDLGTHTIEAGGTITLTYSLNPGTFSYSAETSGKMSNGDQIGKKIVWNYTHDVTGETSKSYDLVITKEWFFLYIQNNGTHDLAPLYVNYGTTEQTKDDILIPMDGVKYQIGYYKAFTNTEVRAYYTDITTSATYWQQGTHFTFPFTENQSITLSNSFLAKITTTDDLHHPGEIQTGTLIPQRVDIRVRQSVDDTEIDVGLGISE